LVFDFYLLPEEYVYPYEQEDNDDDYDVTATNAKIMKLKFTVIVEIAASSPLYLHL
jgi:hypothetical protein